jgi:two-component system, NarL family, sensor histidine kinase UhpB
MAASRRGTVAATLPDPGSAPSPLRAPRWTATAAPLRHFWHRRSLRAQLLIIVIAIQAAASLLAGGVTILKARTSTQIEIEASFRLAGLLVEETVRLIREDDSAARILQTMPLRLRSLRHVRIAIYDAAGDAIPRPDEPADQDIADERRSAPSWFRALIASPVRSRTIPVVAHGQTIGTVVLASEPADEIAEAWENAVPLGLVIMALNLAVLGVLHTLFGRALAPIAGFARALTDLERRDYGVRLPLPAAQEFAALTARFNALAETLAAARTENLALSRRLISAEDDERRRTALELHDEVGPCLFGLRATATSLAGLDSKAAAAAVPGRARDMLAIIERLQAVNRNLLNRLRPMALGHVPVRDLLEQILRDRRREHPHLALSLLAPRLAASYGDAVDLTIYRCVQESLTNAIRHGRPTSVRVRLSEIDAVAGDGGDLRSGLDLRVEDDGSGFAGATPWGFGLRGMQERVVALGGAFAIARRDGGGTAVQVTIPLGPVPAPVADRGEGGS